MIHVMTDIETLAVKSTKPALMQLAAVKFDGERVFDAINIGISIADCMRYGLEVEGGTLEWWLDPKREQARIELAALPKIELDSALNGFADWVFETPEDQRGSNWGKGATFDNVRLKSAFDAVGLEYPFTYRQDECYRTMANRFPDVEFVMNGTAHNGIADAQSQAEHLIEICKKHGIQL